MARSCDSVSGYPDPTPSHDKSRFEHTRFLSTAALLAEPMQRCIAQTDQSLN
jgi:hypothetical protein